MGWEIVRSFYASIERNVEERGGGKKDYCQLVIEGIGVLTREIRLWRGRSGDEDGTKENS